MSSSRWLYHLSSVSGGAFVLGAVACSGGGDDTGDTDSPEVELTPVCEAPTDVPCVDAIISDLSLHDDLVSEGKVKNRTDGTDFVTSIDASAGGFENALLNPWVYVKFTESGAERVDIDDETALESMDWDLAARRFILRLNGGSSGPSCVGAAPFLSEKYADLTEVASDVTYLLDDYYTDSCAIINDSSGLEASPQVALASWWEYPSGCVATTAVPFQVQLADGHVIKMVVEQYYGTGQDTCNQSGVPGGESGNYQLRWTFLQ